VDRYGVDTQAEDTAENSNNAVPVEKSGAAIVDTRHVELTVSAKSWNMIRMKILASAFGDHTQ